MKAKVLKTFRDKTTKKLCVVGTTINCDDKRVKALEEMGYVKSEAQKEDTKKPTV